MRTADVTSFLAPGIPITNQMRPFTNLTKMILTTFLLSIRSWSKPARRTATSQPIKLRYISTIPPIESLPWSSHFLRPLPTISIAVNIVSWATDKITAVTPCCRHLKRRRADTPSISFQAACPAIPSISNYVPGGAAGDKICPQDMHRSNLLPSQWKEAVPSWGYGEEFWWKIDMKTNKISVLWSGDRRPLLDRGNITCEVKRSSW